MASTSSPPPPNIIALKRDFIQTQVRILSGQVLAPSPAWHRAVDDVSTASSSSTTTPAAALPAAALDLALSRLNHSLHQHCSRAYPPQATRFVAEQIDRLYWAAARPGGDGNGEWWSDGGVVVGVDLTNDDVIASLPTPWPFPAHRDAMPLEANRFAEQRARLAQLSERRSQLRARVARLRRMHAVLEPFQTTTRTMTMTAVGEATGEAAGETAGVGVQENLVTRGGEIERELERMKMLLARVGGRVALLPPAASGLSSDQDLPVADDEEEVVEQKELRVVGVF